MIGSTIVFGVWVSSASAEGLIPANAHDQIILALIAIVATSVAGLVYIIKNTTITKAAAKNAYEANKAVNNIGPGDHRLYDVISRIETKQADFDKLWGNLPSHMNSAVTLSETIHDIQDSIKKVDLALTAHIQNVEAEIKRNQR